MDALSLSIVSMLTLLLPLSYSIRTPVPSPRSQATITLCTGAFLKENYFKETKCCWEKQYINDVLITQLVLSVFFEEM